MTYTFYKANHMEFVSMNEIFIIQRILKSVLFYTDYEKVNL